MSRTVVGVLLVQLFIAAAAAAERDGKITSSDLPRDKQTVWGLYMTARQAYEKWRADPEEVKIIDVRTPEEYIFVGHPDMAVNLPLIFPKYEWDANRRRYGVEANADFLADAQEMFTPNDTLLVMCRSGGRAALAINMLARAGYQKVYNIVDGMEGDKVKEPGSLFHGKRIKNGWKNAGLPWTYDINPDLVWHPHENQLEEVRTALDL